MSPDKSTYDLTEDEYETLVVHFGEQLTAILIREGWSPDEAPKVACDALSNTFQTFERQSVDGWLADAGHRLGVSTVDCEGA